MSTTKEKATAAVATLFNPLATKERELLTFWTTFWPNDVGDLSLALKRDFPNPEAIRYLDVDKQSKLIKNHSSIVALLLNNTINVYGVTAEHTPTLKRLSPTLEPLGVDIPIKKFASLAGITNPENSQGWLYYLTGHTNTVVAEYEIGTKTEPKLIEEPIKETYIAAAFYKSPNAVERRVFFQAKKKAPQIRVIDVVEDEDETIKETDNAKEPSPLAVCTVKNSAGDDVNYLYYIDKKNNLWRATGRDKKEFRSNPVLHKQEPVTISPSSQLAVTPGPKHNLVSYTVEKDGKHLLTFFADERK